MRTLIALIAIVALVGCANDTPWQPLPPSLRAPAVTSRVVPLDPDERDALDHDRVAPTTSAYVVDIFLHGTYGAIFALAFSIALFHRRRAAVAQAASPTAPLVDGPSVVMGTVEADPGWQGPMVRIDIHQAGKEWIHKGSWSHNWTETHRTTNHRPFVIVRDNGQRVQIEPDARVVLHDTPDIVRHSHEQRTKVAAIEVGQRINVSGTLAGGAIAQSAGGGGAYRAGFGTAVLRPPPMGRMVISNEPIGAASLARMRFHRGWAIAVAVMFAFAAMVVVPAFELLSLTGRTTWTVPSEVRSWRVWHKPKNSSGYWVRHWGVRATYNDEGAQRTVEDDVGEGWYDCIVNARCPEVPFVVSSVAPSWHQIGTSPGITTGRVVYLVIAWLVLVFAYPISVFASRPWYMKKKVVDGGSGRL